MGALMHARQSSTKHINTCERDGALRTFRITRKLPSEICLLAAVLSCHTCIDTFLQVYPYWHARGCTWNYDSMFGHNKISAGATSNFLLILYKFLKEPWWARFRQSVCWASPMTKSPACSPVFPRVGCICWGIWLFSSVCTFSQAIKKSRS